ncbi:hypothetical protein Ciccas_008315 [Cichlidogyrus casuarinus]|uniref:Uncharacterized protein n=1 Tax=Cichlidogyrus casuarinus TaxID=1844966 RepID=A0ABD2Q1J5_9PLAT
MKTTPRRSRSLTSLTTADFPKNRVRWIDQVRDDIKDSETDSDLNNPNQCTSSSENTDDLLRNDFLFGMNEKIKPNECDKQLHLFERIHSMESKYHSELGNLQKLYEQEIDKCSEKNRIDLTAYKEEISALKMKFNEDIDNLHKELLVAKENYENLKIDSKNKMDELEEHYSLTEKSARSEYDSRAKALEEEKESELEKLKILHCSETKFLADKFDAKYRELMEQLEAKSSELQDYINQLEKERASTALATERMQHAQTKLQQTNLILEDLHDQYQDAKER